MDVRDSADAWVRIVVREGDVLLLAPHTKRRLPAAGTPVIAPRRLPPTDHVAADAASRQSTVCWPLPAPASLARWGAVQLAVPAARAAAVTTLAAALTLRFVPGSAEEEAANVPHLSLIHI